MYCYWLIGTVLLLPSLAADGDRLSECYEFVLAVQYGACWYDRIERERVTNKNRVRVVVVGGLSSG